MTSEKLGQDWVQSFIFRNTRFELRANNFSSSELIATAITELSCSELTELLEIPGQILELILVC